MKTTPIVPRASSPPAGPASVDGLARARQVFLRGSGLPERWRGRERFTLLEAGFGAGHDFLATWAAWREDPARPRRLHFVAIEKHPPTREALGQWFDASPLSALAGPLQAAWPPLTHGLHRLDFEGGAVQLLLAFGDVGAWLPALVLQADAFWLNDVASPREAAAWDRWRCRSLNRLAAPGAMLAAAHSSPALHEDLAGAGFEVLRAAGEITVARHASTFRAAPPAGRPVAARGRDAVIVGAGLAGASVAAALSAQGWHCRVLDRGQQPAAETSGNAGGLFHPVVHPDDGPHARLHRAGALWTARTLRAAQAGGLSAQAGAARGLLRLADDRPVATLQAMAAQLGLPADFAQVLDAPAASALAGVKVSAAAWHFHEAGWLDPHAWVHHRLQAPGVVFRGGIQVHGVQPRAGGGWRVLDARGQAIDEAEVLVLACASGLPALLPPLQPLLQAVRGQVTLVPADMPGARPALPLAGAGYVLSLPDGRLLCGATSQPGELDTDVREADHRHNLAQWMRLAGAPVWPSLDRLSGRVGWRQLAPDRLPLAGGAPLAWAEGAGPAGRTDQPRLLARQPGLLVLGGLASRGLTTAGLLAETLAAGLSGAPLPLEADLLDAVDPARFLARRARAQAQRVGSGSGEGLPAA